MNTNANVQTAAQGHRPYKRKVKNFIIHRPMQREFSFMLILLFMVASATCAYFIHQTIYDAAFGSHSLQFVKINPLQILSDVSYAVIIRVTLVLIVTLLIIGGYGIVFLHRVAGPIHRLRQTLLKMNRGETVTEVKLREGDFFHELAHDVNTLIKHSQAGRAKVEEIKNGLNEISRSVVSDDDRSKLRRLREVADSISQV